jgi:hypothetical protein
MSELNPDHHPPSAAGHKDDIVSAVSSKLKCVRCGSNLKSPIYMCTEGHAFCCLCTSATHMYCGKFLTKGGRDPCRGTYSTASVRAKNIEEIVQCMDLPLPCK